MDKLIKHLGLILLILPIIPVLAISYSFLQLPHPGHVVVVNKDQVFAEYIRALSKYPLDEERINYETLRFRRAFDATLNMYVAKHHALILDQKAILAVNTDATTDATSEVMRGVAKLMKEKS